MNGISVLNRGRRACVLSLLSRDTRKQVIDKPGSGLSQIPESVAYLILDSPAPGLLEMSAYSV